MATRVLCVDARHRRSHLMEMTRNWSPRDVSGFNENPRHWTMGGIDRYLMERRMLQPKMTKASGLKRKTRAWNAQFSGRRRRPGATGWSFLYLPPARISPSGEATAATPDVLAAQQRSIWSLLMALFVLSAAASSDVSMCRSSGGSGTLQHSWKPTGTQGL